MNVNYRHSKGATQFEFTAGRLNPKWRLLGGPYSRIGIWTIVVTLALYLPWSLVTRSDPGILTSVRSLASTLINNTAFPKKEALWSLAMTTILVLGFLGVAYRRRAQRRKPRGEASVSSELHAPRAEFLHRIERIVTEHPDLTYSLALFDIDGFKIMNDRHGQTVADEVLLHLSDNLSMWLPKTAHVARFGSDEFLAFLPNTTLDDAYGLALAVVEGMGGQRAATANGRSVCVSLSAGVASYPGTSQDLRDAIGQATSALQGAKECGRGSVERARKNTVGLCRLGAQVESALHDQRIRPAYQPIIDLATGRPIAEEGLARIVLPEGHILGADLFIDAATDLRLTSRIDCCLMEQALDRCRTQSAHGDRRLRFMNVSAAFLNERRMLEKIALSFTSCDVLRALVGDSNPLVVEITERELLRDPKKALECLQPLLDLGVRLAIDDFGSGYSSFLYLTTLPISFLKVEMELLKAARSSQRARSILRGIKAIADDLEMVTIAEGIEDEELATIATDLGMNWGQGFYFGKPALAETAPTTTATCKQAIG